MRPSHVPAIINARSPERSIRGVHMHDLPLSLSLSLAAMTLRVSRDYASSTRARISQSFSSRSITIYEEKGRGVRVRRPLILILSRPAPTYTRTGRTSCSSAINTLGARIPELYLPFLPGFVVNGNT